VGRSSPRRDRDRQNVVITTRETAGSLSAAYPSSTPSSEISFETMESSSICPARYRLAPGGRGPAPGGPLQGPVGIGAERVNPLALDENSRAARAGSGVRGDSHGAHPRQRVDWCIRVLPASGRTSGSVALDGRRVPELDINRPVLAGADAAGRAVATGGQAAVVGVFALDRLAGDRRRPPQRLERK
jgi:hypothetical protein